MTSATNTARGLRLGEVADKGAALGFWTVAKRNLGDGWASYVELKDAEGNLFSLMSGREGRLSGSVAWLDLGTIGRVGTHEVRFAGDRPTPTFAADGDTLTLCKAIKRRLLDAGKELAQAVREEAAKRVDMRCRLEAQARELDARGFRTELGSNYYEGKAWHMGQHHSVRFTYLGAVTFERVTVRRVDLVPDLLALLGTEG